MFFNKVGGDGFLLDTYTGSAGAWSLRKLSSSTTNVVRVQRDSDLVEQDFTPTQLTDGTLTTFASGGKCRAWKMYDQSGNGIDMIAPIIGLGIAPIITDASGNLILLNGLPAIEQENNSLRCSLSAATTFPSGDGLLSTCFEVGAHISGAFTIGEACLSGICAKTFLADRRSVLHSIEASGSAYAVRLQGGNTVFTTTDSAKQSVWTTYRDVANTGAPFKARQDGVALVQSAAGSNVLNMQTDSGFTMFANGTTEYGTSDPSIAQLRMQESIWWLSDNTSNASGIETNMNNYYTIY